MQVHHFSPVVAATVVLVFISLCGVSGTYSLNSHSEAAEFPPHSEASLSQPTPLVSRLKVLTDRADKIRDWYTYIPGDLRHMDNRPHLDHREARNTYPTGFNPLPPVQPSLRIPSDHVGQLSEFLSARNNPSKNLFPWKWDARLPVEFRTRLFNQPNTDTGKHHVITSLPEGFPGRELTQLECRGFNRQTLTESLQKIIAGCRKCQKSTLAPPDRVDISSTLTIELGTAKRKYYRFLLNGRGRGDMVGIRHDSNGVAISNALKKKLELGLSILLMYCKKDDPNTYYELIWELNDSKYSAEILMAYFTRVYHYAAIQPFTPGRNSKESEDAIIKALKSARANICSRGSPGDGKIILYTLQGLPTGPM